MSLFNSLSGCYVRTRNKVQQKFSKNFKAAEILKDDKVSSTFNELRKYSDLPYSCHRKCYQKYTLKRELQKLRVSERTGSARVSERRKDRGGIKN